MFHPKHRDSSASDNGHAATVWPEPAEWQLPSGLRLTIRFALALFTVMAVVGTIGRSVKDYDLPEAGPFDASRQGQFDFHNGTYFPGLAFIQGVNPYGQHFADTYPVSRQMPLYSPFVLLLHAPWAWMPLQISECLYFVFNLGLLVGIGWLAVASIPEVSDRWTWGLLAIFLMVASRAGHSCLFTGYFTAELALATLLALEHATSRPWVSGIAIAIAACKPTYGIPLLMMMAARGNWPAITRGVWLSALGGILAAGFLIYHIGFEQMLTDMVGGQKEHMADSYESPINTWTRIDLLAAIAKWLHWNPTELQHLIGMFVLLPLPVLALWKLRQSGDRTGCTSLSGVIITVSMISTLYHHTYDAIVLVPAAIAILLNRHLFNLLTIPFRVGLAAALLLPSWNYLSAEFVLDRLTTDVTVRRIITSISPAVLAMAWLAICAMAIRNTSTWSASAAKPQL